MTTPAGAVSTDNNGDIVAYKKLSRGGSLFGSGCVISIDELYIISLTVDIDCGVQRVCILDTENFLLAAGGILTAGRLENAYLDDLLITAGSRLTAAAAVDEILSMAEQEC